ncbi:UvrD-helicase domain-containing protein [Kribbella sp. NPDC051587]|uniref:UvrD-helicase domain-containing protein n=1 Tax=Kribbella sp. NPDC051587 TaxID=3364119 RepID=UPI0037A07201
MSPRSHSPNTAADLEVASILDNPEISGFTMIAGAGSGKTTSLVKALEYVIRHRGEQMLADRQQVACITYTEIARQEIEDDLASNPLAHVSTIHSFLWTLVEPFHHDIQNWLRQNGQAELEQLEAKYTNPNSRTQQQTRETQRRKIERRREELAGLDEVTSFQLGVATNYGQGIVGYADILKLTPELILKKPLFAKLVSRRYPVVFVDESQDTFKAVVACLRHIAVAEQGHFCLGFFGDPVQKIYTTGVGSIDPEPAWVDVKKPENFRSPLLVLDVINAIRHGADQLKQISGLPTGKQVVGEVTYFVLPSDADRPELLAKARTWLEANSAIGAWRLEGGVDPAKVLVITHRMAATRLRFTTLFDVFDKTRLRESFLEGKAWPLTPFLSTLLPLVQAAQGNRADLMPRLRKSSPLLKPGVADQSTIVSTLATLKDGVDKLSTVVANGGPGSLGEALSIANDYSLVDLPERLLSALPAGAPGPAEDAEEQDRMLAALMKCDVAELQGYADYISNLSPYSTQQGVKGTEYPDVLVVLDDDEGYHPQFSFDKLLGLRKLSAAEAKKGPTEETTIDRTRRLLYVCASRATRSLAIVLYAKEPDTAVAAIEEYLPHAGVIVTAEQLDKT